MTQLAFAYEPFTFAPTDAAPAEWFIERRRSNAKGFSDWLYEHKRLQREGWDLMILLARDESHVVALGCRGGGSQYLLGGAGLLDEDEEAA